MELKSSAFEASNMIPSKHTCDGIDTSPPLTWASVPPKTRSFALIADDPDAPRGTWVHCVLWNIPADARALEEGVAKRDALPNGAKQDDGLWQHWLRRSLPSVRYPPLLLQALRARHDAHAAVVGTKQDLEQAMKGHVLAHAELMG